ncbi:MAG: cyclic pyranopterin monophosphate synthase MoaC [Eubacterium sp.]
MSEDFTHFNAEGRSRMVDVTHKKDTERMAVARGKIRMKPETLDKILKNQMKKGDVLSVAQIGGIMGCKRTWELIPMCHNILITGSDLKFMPDVEQSCIYIEAELKTTGKTGIEMEALTAVSVAALTIYDMCKAIDREMVIEDICLVKKTGGYSGIFVREEEAL